jgi:hypothetical protein
MSSLRRTILYLQGYRYVIDEGQDLEGAQSGASLFSVIPKQLRWLGLRSWSTPIGQWLMVPSPSCTPLNPPR